MLKKKSSKTAHFFNLEQLSIEFTKPNLSLKYIFSNTIDGDCKMPILIK